MQTIYYYESREDYLEACDLAYHLAALVPFTSEQDRIMEAQHDNLIREASPASLNRSPNTIGEPTPQDFVECICNWLDIQMTGWESDSERARR